MSKSTIVPSCQVVSYIYACVHGAFDLPLPPCTVTEKGRRHGKGAGPLPPYQDEGHTGSAACSASRRTIERSLVLYRAMFGV